MSSAVPAGFTVVSLIAAFNEEDVIDQVVTDLIQQGIAVYLIDDGSTDQTAAVVSRHLGRGLLKIERRERNPEFDWTSLLRRKEELACQLEADWFLHQDADEFRESPWLDVGLREALWQVDRQGYNAVDFKVLNFRPTHQQPVTDDVRTSMRFYEHAAEWDALQVKAWRKQPAVNLTLLGGHDAQFEGQRVCPIRFLSRHYPVRSQAHGTRKIFAERRPRFSGQEREKGWHVQYDGIESGHDFVREASELLEYDPIAVRVGLTLEHRDVTVLTAQLDSVRDEQASQVRELEHRLAVAQSQGDAHLEALARSREDLLAADQKIAILTEEIARLTHAVEKGQRDVGQLIYSLLASAHVVRRSQERQTYLQSQVGEYAAELAGTRAEVDALRASASWRITAPVRALYRLALPPQPTSSPDIASRLKPVSDVWGVDRGQPVDRYYIEGFLRHHKRDVRGRVLEVKDPFYTQLLNEGQVSQSDVLDIDRSNQHATLIADLADGKGLESDQFDCFILTQTLHIIYDIRSALMNAVRVLKPGGILLCTVPAVSRVNYEDGGLECGDYWRLTQSAVRRLFDEVMPAGSVDVVTYGNVAVCAAFLYGLSSGEIPNQDLDFVDPWFPLIHCVRAVKA